MLPHGAPLIAITWGRCIVLCLVSIWLCCLLWPKQPRIFCWLLDCSCVWWWDHPRTRSSLQSKLPGLLQGKQGMHLEDHGTWGILGGAEVPVFWGIYRWRQSSAGCSFRWPCEQNKLSENNDPICLWAWPIQEMGMQLVSKTGKTERMALLWLISWDQVHC